MKNRFYSLLLLVLVFASCSNEPSLQKYFVEKGENKDFVGLDIAPNLMMSDSIQLSADEKKAVESLKKMNVLIFRATDTNKPEYEQEKTAVKEILKDEKYDELIKFNSGGQGASVTTMGEGEKIEEVVVFVHNDDNGFGVIRVLGKDMTPNNVMTLVGLLQKANLNMTQLEPLRQLMDNKRD